MRRSLQLAVAAALLGPSLGGTRVGADVLVPRSGPPVRGVLVARTASELAFNPYNSRNPGMTFGVMRLQPEQVRRIDLDPPAEPEVFRRLQARAAGDAAELRAIAGFATVRRLKRHAEMAWALLLAETPTDAEALAAIGGAARFGALRKGNPLLDAGLLAALRRYAEEAAPAERRKLGVDVAARGFAAKPEELERWRRSALQPRGYQEDIPLSLHADRYADAVYTLFVPDGYDPATPWPLLIGLHGGGPDGKAVDEVVGSGPSAMSFYRGLAAERGVIVACPTAQMAGWGNQVNEDLVRDVIAEVRLLYHVDVDRIHLTGHSMGGYGTWALGPRMADLFATVSPMAGAGDGNVKPLVDTRTPIFVYHSADDFIPVQPDRDAANRLRESGLDFIYTELDHEGHGCPESVRVELFDFLMPRRNHDPKAKDTWPRSSFLGKATAEEKAYLGDPLAELEGRAPGTDERLAALRLGGGVRPRGRVGPRGDEARGRRRGRGEAAQGREGVAVRAGRGGAPAGAAGRRGRGARAAQGRRGGGASRHEPARGGVRPWARRGEGRRGGGGARDRHASLGGLVREQAVRGVHALLRLGARRAHARRARRRVGRPRRRARGRGPRQGGRRARLRGGPEEGGDLRPRPAGPEPRPHGSSRARWRGRTPPRRHPPPRGREAPRPRSREGRERERPPRPRSGR